VVLRIAGEHNLPAENLIAPDYIRRLAWQPPEEITDETVAETLRGFGAREWQLALLLPALASALTTPTT
jgi:ribonuclease D